MTPFYLVFTDEAEANSVLYTITPSIEIEFGVATADAVVTPNYANIDVIGILYEPTPEPMPLDYVPVAVNGYHVNVLVLDSEDSAPLNPYVVTPKTPRRIWA